VRSPCPLSAESSPGLPGRGKIERFWQRRFSGARRVVEKNPKGRHA